MVRDFDLVIVGMGSGGLVAAEFAAETLGLRVAAVERDRLGGDCLWTGCVPSKALLASARVAHRMRTADRYGLPATEPEIDSAAVWRRIHSVQDEIARTDDNPDRFREMGVELVFGPARLTDPQTVEVDGTSLSTRFILLTTGSRPAVPPIEGLAEAGFVTSESVFELDRAPRSLVIVGGGPIAVELAQAFRRLGCAVTVLQRAPRLLGKDEPELAELLTAALREEGVEVRTGVRVERVTVEGGRKLVHGTEDGRPARWSGEEILVAAGRTPSVDGLGLEEVGVKLRPRGIVVDRRLRTSVRSIYAAGDVAGRFLFTHSAAYESVIAVRNMFFPGSQRVTGLVPWCTFTEPELAHAGLTIEQARERHGAGRVAVRRIDLDRSDRARADSATRGRVVLVTARGRLVGAHVLAPAAGELIHELALAIRKRTRLEQLANLIHVYPTLSISTAQLAAEAAYERARRFRWLARGRVRGRAQLEPGGITST
jgi:pyruvate/2-oxoglutarate dehydrogenase complex dihydrolipoamide dehydrogenase (E3) component